MLTASHFPIGNGEIRHLTESKPPSQNQNPVTDLHEIINTDATQQQATGTVNNTTATAWKVSSINRKISFSSGAIQHQPRKPVMLYATFITKDE